MKIVRHCEKCGYAVCENEQHYHYVFLLYEAGQSDWIPEMSEAFSKTAVREEANRKWPGCTVRCVRMVRPHRKERSWGRILKMR